MRLLSAETSQRGAVCLAAGADTAVIKWKRKTGAAKTQVETMNMCHWQLPPWAGAGNEGTDGERDRKHSKKS